MAHRFFQHCCKRDSGQALIWCLLLLGLSALAITGIARVALWKLDSSFALMNQRKILEDWEVQRVNIINNAYPTNSFKWINLPGNSLVTPVIPKRFSNIDFLRIPVFSLGDKDETQFDWGSYLKAVPNGCRKLENHKCSELNSLNGNSLYFGDLEIDTIDLKKGRSLIVASGKVTIKNLKMSPNTSLEIFSGFDLQIFAVTGEANSTLFLKSANSRIKLTNVKELDCLSLPRIKISSKTTIEFRGSSLRTSGCSSVELSKFWQNLRFLGDLSQKSLNY